MNFFCYVPQRANVEIDRIQEFLLDRDSSGLIQSRAVLAQKPVIYTEFYDSTRVLLTFKDESVDGSVGNPVLVILANGFNMSNVLENSNVILHSMGGSQIYHVLTFRDDSEAKHFCNSLRRYFNPNLLVSIPPGLQEFLDTVMSIFET